VIRSSSCAGLAPAAHRVLTMVASECTVAPSLFCRSSQADSGRFFLHSRSLLQSYSCATTFCTPSGAARYFPVDGILQSLDYGYRIPGPDSLRPEHPGHRGYLSGRL
jgi:hypothetical protein